MSDEAEIDPHNDETVLATIPRFQIAYELDDADFPPGHILALLIAEEVVFLNTNWNRNDWPEDAKRTIRVIVNCNDVFAWGCADGEECDADELAEVYRHWEKDHHWGPAVWCMKKRQQMPQPPVERAIRAAGIWDLDEMMLPANTLDADVSAMFPSLRSPS